jgi:antitoxin component YwqK of YwqJK toxin-antitoxin module
MKSKTLLVVLFIGIIHYSFGQRLNLTTLKTENGKYLNGNNPYSGLVYELYASGFLKSESAIKNGVCNGLVKKYIDNTKSISTYQDSVKLKQYDDTLSHLSKKLFQLYKDSANYSVKIKRVFDEEIKTREKLDEWKQKYDEGKLRGNKLEIYTELRNASFGLDASMTDLKLARSNNLYFQRERKTEKNKPVYTNILSETYTYVDGNQSGIHIIYKKSGEKEIEETLDNGKKNGPYKRYSGNKIVEEGNYVNNEKEGEWTTLNSSEKITQNYSKGKLNGAYKRYDGAVLKESGQYVEGMKNGEWKNFDYYGKLLELKNYKSDKFDGAFKKYYGDVVIEEGTYSNGLKNGKFEFLVENGTKRNATYINDVLSKMTISCPELTSELQKLPKCIVDISINDDLSSQYQAIEFMIKGDNYLKQGDHEKAIYAYRDGIKKYRLQVLFDRIVPLGDYCYQQKHSGHVQDAYEHYLLTKQDEIRQNKFNACKAKSDKFMKEFYESAEEIVNEMSEDLKGRNSISNSNENNKELQKEASKNCDTYIYICNDCSKMFSSKSEPNDRTTCTEPRWKGINSSFHDGKHQWQKIGRCGSDSFYCKGCGNRISVSETPARGTCGAKGNNCCSHNWLRD